MRIASPKLFSGADKSQDSVKASEGEDSSATNKENTSEQSKDENGKVKICFSCVFVSLII